jgi:2-keto-3-deoxy-6-phosphogluconate aldolase
VPDSAAVDRLRVERVVAVIRAPSRDEVLAAVDALVAGGQWAVEVTYSTLAAARALADVARRHAPG